VVGFNPHTPGRLSYVFHTYSIANLRLVLDVDVQPGNQTPGTYARRALFDLIESLPEDARPAFIRGDISFGTEATMKEAEQRGVDYLFKLRQTKNVKRLIEVLFRDGQWIKAAQGWKGRILFEVERMVLPLESASLLKCMNFPNRVIKPQIFQLFNSRHPFIRIPYCLIILIQQSIQIFYDLAGGGSGIL